MKVAMTLPVDALCALRDVGYAASTDSHRTALTTVRLQLGKSALWAVATDAYMLVVRKVADLPQGIDRSGESGVNVPADALSKAIRDALKVPRRTVCLGREVDIDADGINVATQTGSVGVRAFVIDNGKYPDWAKSIVQPYVDKKPVGSGSDHVALNPAFVDRLGRALSCTPDNGAALRIELRGPLEPILAGKIGDPDGFGLLMPVRDPADSSAYPNKKPRAEEKAAA